MILEKIESNYMWVLIFILLLNLSQRKIEHTQKKRIATIWLCSLVLVFEVGIVTILTKDLNHYWAWAVLAMCIIVGVFFRDRVWPFRFHCISCHRKLDYNHIVGHDDNLCQDCYDKEHPEEAEKRKKTEIKKEVEIEKTPIVVPDKVDELDWDAWEPSDICVITYLFDNDKVLLIDKKTGLGSGMVNAPGGHVEIAETANEAAIREFKEETGLDISSPTKRGELRFQFKDGLGERAYVYFAYAYSGELRECEEARPFWNNISEIPYERMWADDIKWLPLALEGKRFLGTFIFDGEKMVDGKVEVREDD
ncbi:MAG: 8-oxo-dGTP diphosphatase [Sphaerochaetaceae bacterium]